MVLGTFLGGAHGHKVGTGFGMDNLQQWGAGGGCEGSTWCIFLLPLGPLLTGGTLHSAQCTSLAPLSCSRLFPVFF